VSGTLWSPRFVGSLRGAVPHAAMTSVMLIVMVGPFGDLGWISGSIVLLTGAVLCSPRARADNRFRTHVVDFWVMALFSILMLAMTVSAGSGTVRASSSRSAAAVDMLGMRSAMGAGSSDVHVIIALVVLVVAWAASRLFLIRRSARAGHDVATGLLMAIGLGAMLLL